MEIDDTLTDIETYFNIAGSLPVVSFFSSVLRFLAGKVQAIAGFLICLVGLGGQCFDSDNARKWEGVTHEGGIQLIQGALNMVRSVGECVLALTIFGSLILWFGQAASENGFKPLVPYPQATLRQNIGYY
jgi:hypothetical protein